MVGGWDKKVLKKGTECLGTWRNVRCHTRVFDFLMVSMLTPTCHRFLLIKNVVGVSIMMFDMFTYFGFPFFRRQSALIFKCGERQHFCSVSLRSTLASFLKLLPRPSKLFEQSMTFKIYLFTFISNWVSSCVWNFYKTQWKTYFPEETFTRHYISISLSEQM